MICEPTILFTAFCAIFGWEVGKWLYKKIFYVSFKNPEGTLTVIFRKNKEAEEKYRSAGWLKN